MLLIFCLLLCLGKGLASRSDAVLLGDVKALTLHKGEYTTARRGRPIPQLQCIGGSAGCSFTPDVVQCMNKGFDGNDYQWECKAEMDKKFRFGKMGVSCEGYNSPDDPYILKGSCGLEYSLELTTGNHGSYQRDSSYSAPHGYKKSSDHNGSTSLIVILCIIGVVLAVLWFSKTTRSPTDPSQPPPYGFSEQAPPPPGFNYSPPPPGYGASPPPPPYGFKTASSGQASSGGGGFWTGAGIGGVLGYLFGSRNNNAYGSSYPGTGRHGSSAFGGWESSFGTQSSPSSPSSSDTRTSSGFAGTKRR